MGHTRILPIQSSGFALIWGTVYPFIVLFKILLPCWWECIIKENAGTGKDSGDKGKGKSTIDNHYVKDMLKLYDFEIFQLWRIYLNKKLFVWNRKYCIYMVCHLPAHHQQQRICGCSARIMKSCLPTCPFFQTKLLICYVLCVKKSIRI